MIRADGGAWARIAIFACLLATSLTVSAIDTLPDFRDPALQARYEKLIHELRCLQCQNNSIADSPGGLAGDLRRSVHDLLQQGKTDQEILAFMTARYGDFVLYKPPFVPRTWLLWLAPVLLLGGGVIVAWRIVAGRSRLVADNWPLLTEALAYVAHAQIRNRGTVGGSVAHADPAAELPVAFLTLDADIVVRSKRGERIIPARDFFVTHLTTAMEPDELLVAIDVPAMPEGAGHAFTEFARRHGDFALVTAVVAEIDGAVRITLGGVGPVPRRATRAERVIADGGTARAAASAAAEEIDPTADLHGSAPFRRAIAAEMVRRALARARID